MAPDLPSTTDVLLVTGNEPRDDPYDGLNRAQRRKAQAAERRAFKKRKR